MDEYTGLTFDGEASYAVPDDAYLRRFPEAYMACEHCGRDTYMGAGTCDHCGRVPVATEAD
jgi:hypothetical protein